MKLATIQRILGMLLMLSSGTMLPPAWVAFWSHDGTVSAFLTSFVLLLVVGLALWLPVHRARQELRVRDGYMIVVTMWLAVGFSSAVPITLAAPELSITDAVFEAFSGLTTTGATIFEELEVLPLSLLYYRAQLQWLGGMGIVVLAVAILPLLGIGGVQLYRAETPSPMKDSKLTPRVKETAKALWYIYAGLTVVCCIAYWLAGMDWFDAVTHSFTTIAIGGFSTHTESFAFFDSALIEAVAVVFMILSGMNFALHFRAWRVVSIAPYAGDAELRAYLKILCITAVIAGSYLAFAGIYPDVFTAVHNGIFQAVSIGTTTGYTTDAFWLWPGFLPLLLIMVSFIGGCGGSTAGGIKVVRSMLLYRQGVREIRVLLHPNAYVPIRAGGIVVAPQTLTYIWGFFSLYVACLCFGSLVLAATGLDLVTAISAVAACLNNLGPGLGEVGPNYASISNPAKWALVIAMLLGRLEIYTLLIIFTPAFWRD